MKKNKTIAYALAATLLVGGTFAGTKAWFTDQETVNSDLIITTGNIEVSTVDLEGGWRLKNHVESNKTSQAVKGEDGKFTNVRPGDVFIKEVDIKNTGSLNQKLEVTGGLDLIENDHFNVTTNFLNDANGAMLKPDDTRAIEIIVEVSKKMDNDWQNKPFNLEDAMSPIVINAKQVNASNN